MKFIKLDWKDWNKGGWFHWHNICNLLTRNPYYSYRLGPFIWQTKH